MESSNNKINKICPLCEREFRYSTENCWCNDFPPIFELDSEIDCLCPKCLKQVTAKKIDAYVSSIASGEVTNNKAKDLPKTNKLIIGIDYYMDGDLFVLKSWYHLKRGYCCNNGCRHCPYGYKKQTE